MEPYKVIHDVIPKNTQQRLQDVINERTFSWHIMKSASFADSVKVPKFWTNIETIGYVKPIYFEGAIISKEILPWCLQILDAALDKANIEMEELLRIQVNLLYQNVNVEYKQGMWTTAHIDQDFDHKVLLYYVNDSDGDTFLFNEKRGEEFDHFTEMARVTPKAGSAIIFDGKHFHSASNPINNNKRLAINFNFK